ncbi:DAK2 domain-containing protein [Actinomyces sp. B33]|uniref:DAK2 domain-containing protein n=1 Tax=Actinomyces sp. B33 TaxID=2942131 RepID=UPI0023409DFC|nr:DAK2 domain-containing protein [Actinomyces sp. B33]MDC4232497.1 DAK2 domain-containing protein [Actinomyces sp. B33]
MRSAELIEQITQTMRLLTESADELRDLDQVLGDGDLGITISAGANAVAAAMGDVSPASSPSDITKACARAFANANPSTMAALVAGGLLAGTKVWAGKDEVDLADAVEFIRAAAASISYRGKSQVGDKTILDAMVPAVDALEAHGDDPDPLGHAIAASARAVVETRTLQSRKGRASWLQDRSIGLQDPGATAFLRALEAWRDAASGERGPQGAL